MYYAIIAYHFSISLVTVKQFVYHGLAFLQLSHEGEPDEILLEVFVRTPSPSLSKQVFKTHKLVCAHSAGPAIL